MFAPTAIAPEVVPDAALKLIHDWSALTEKPTAPAGFSPIVKLCAAGAAAPTCALNESALGDAVSADTGACAAIPLPLNRTDKPNPRRSKNNTEPV